MRRSLLVLPLVLAALAGGCTAQNAGSGDFEGEEQDVAEVIDKLGSAGETGNGATICEDVLVKSLADEMAAEGSSCAQQLDDALEDADDFDLTVESVTVEGDTATARVKGRDGEADRVVTFELERTGRDDWRVSSLGA